MKHAKELFDYDSLAFFGRVNASISHELKNIMAIISETAGLLSDLSDLATSGTPIDPDMLKSSAGSIMEEIQRGFTTIRQMNRFSHSVDNPVADIDLMEILDLVCHLSNYLSFTGRTHLLPWDGPAPKAQTSPFALQAIIYRALVQNFQNSGPRAELEISIQPNANSGWVIVFTGFCTSDFQVFPDDLTKKTAASIGVSIDLDRPEDRLALCVPLTFQTGIESNGPPELKEDDGTPGNRMEAK